LETEVGLLMSETCLIVAHDPWFIQLLRIYTEEIGYHVSQAYEGQDVLPIVRRNLPDFILVEEDLPGKVKTADLLYALRAEPAIQSLPILVFSWQGQGIDKDMTQFATSHLQAPITFESFVEALKDAGIQLPTGKHPMEPQVHQDAKGDQPDIKEHKDGAI
jgi:CheY-like chemotaxis protein